MKNKLPRYKIFQQTNKAVCKKHGEHNDWRLWFSENQNRYYLDCSKCKRAKRKERYWQNPEQGRKAARKNKNYYCRKTEFLTTGRTLCKIHKKHTNWAIYSNILYCKLCSTEKSRNRRSSKSIEQKRQFYKKQYLNYKKRRIENPELAEKHRAYFRKYYKNNIQYKIRMRAAGRLRDCLKLKLTTTKKYLGCSYLQLKKHLEAQFKPGMTWDNYGNDWHIDHTIPVSWYNLSNHAQQLEAFAYYNCKPMWAEENLKKGNRHAG